MMMLGALVLKHSVLPSGALAYNYQRPKHAHSYPDRVPGKFSEAVFPATGRYLAADERVNGGNSM